MKKWILLWAAMLAVTALAGAATAAYAVGTEGTFSCSESCVGTNNPDIMIGDENNTEFRGKDGGDSISDTAKHDKDIVRSGAGNDRIDVAEGGNAENEIDSVTCGTGNRDQVKADSNDIVRSNCEQITRV